MSEQDRWFMNAYLRILLSKSVSAAGVSLVEHTMAKDFAVPLHVHNDEDETFYMLEGTARFQVEDKVFDAVPGQSFHVPGGTRHSFRVISDVAKFLTVSNGQFEDMVLEASVPAERAELPPVAPFGLPEQQRLAEICNRNGIEFLGPPVE